MSALTNDIAGRIVLATLTISTWRVNKLHKEETRAVRKAHNSDAPRVLITLCKDETLAEIAKVDSEAYATHRDLTMPSVQDGMRMLPAARQMEHSDAMRQLDDRKRALVTQFLDKYDEIKAHAQVELNGLFDEAMWPSKQEMPYKFGLATRYLACPTEGAWGEWLAESARVAEAALRDRLREALERVRDRCKDDGRLYATVFSNLSELVAMVPDLNLTKAVDLDKAARAAHVIAGTSADAVRDDADARKRLGKEASRILTMLGGVK